MIPSFPETLSLSEASQALGWTVSGLRGRIFRGQAESIGAIKVLGRWRVRADVLSKIMSGEVNV